MDARALLRMQLLAEKARGMPARHLRKPSALMMVLAPLASSTGTVLNRWENILREMASGGQE